MFDVSNLRLEQNTKISTKDDELLKNNFMLNAIPIKASRLQLVLGILVKTQTALLQVKKKFFMRNLLQSLSV